MKKTTKVEVIRGIAGIIALVAIVGFTMAACVEEEIGTGTTKGRLTITGLEDYEGWYVTAWTVGNLNLYAGERMGPDVPGKVKSGVVTLKVFKRPSYGSDYNYVGDDKNVYFDVNLEKNWDNGVSSGGPDDFKKGYIRSASFINGKASGEFVAGELTLDD